MEEEWASKYSIIIVGAGIAGNALAYALAMQHPERKVLLLERSLSEPDRIVGELLQPGGRLKLTELGMESCLEGIDAIPVYGYGIITEEGERHKLTYPLLNGDKIEGRSFHHGRFVMKLREKARSAPNVKMVQATATKLLEDEEGVIGVEFKEGQTTKQAYAPLTVLADGCNSNFRSKLGIEKGKYTSHFVGVIIKNCTLPFPNYGHVFLVRPGPILSYQIGSNETRVLVDIPDPLPSVSSGAMQEYLITHTAPQLPEEIRDAFIKAVKEDQIRSMPNAKLHPNEKYLKPGVLLLGDSWNMRHPLTGGGMTVALSDVVLLRDILARFKTFEDRKAVTKAFDEYFIKRKPLAATVNILASALYSVFSASEDPILPLMRDGCMAYFRLGGICVNGPLSLLAGVCPKPWVLITHFFAVAIYGAIRLLFPFPTPYKLYQVYQMLGAASWIVIPLMRGEKVFKTYTAILSFIFALKSRNGSKKVN